MQNQPAPQPPSPPSAFVRIEQGPGGGAQTITLPMTRGEIAEIRVQRAELSNQLISASNRREELAAQLRTASGADKAGLEQRIGVLDQRIVQLESDIAQSGRLLTGAPGLLTSSKEGQMLGGFHPGQVLAFGIVLTIFVLAPIAFGAARMMWKRATAAPVRPAISAETNARLERIEQAVEAIAVEVERVSEGQRFVTKLMSEVKTIPALENTRAFPSTRSGRES